MAEAYLRRTVQLGVVGIILVIAGAAIAIIGRAAARAGNHEDVYQPELIGIEWMLAGAGTITVGLGFLIGAWVAFLMSRPDPGLKRRKSSG